MVHVDGEAAGVAGVWLFTPTGPFPSHPCLFPGSLAMPDLNLKTFFKKKLCSYLCLLGKTVHCLGKLYNRSDVGVTMLFLGNS